MHRGEATRHASCPLPGNRQQPLGRMFQERCRWEVYFCVCLTGEKRKAFSDVQSKVQRIVRSRRSRGFCPTPLGRWKGTCSSPTAVLPVGLGVMKTKHDFFPSNKYHHLLVQVLKGGRRKSFRKHSWQPQPPSHPSFLCT